MERQDEVQFFQKLVHYPDQTLSLVKGLLAHHCVSCFLRRRHAGRGAADGLVVIAQFRHG